MRCPKCGTESNSWAEYCSNCGTSLSPTCPSCGAILEVGMRFCSQCGNRITFNHDIESTPEEKPQISSLRNPPRIQDEAYERRMVTVLFADIVGFSTFSEQIDPEHLLEIMQGVYPCLLEPIQGYAGTVVQVMGDGVLAYFGAPIAKEDDPQRAIMAALEMVKHVEGYAAQIPPERGLGNFNVRIGINTGLVVVGDMHSEKHLEYIALGDAVILAFRLQQNAPPGGVLVSHATYRHVHGLFEVQSQAPMKVKGRQQSEQTYLVRCLKPVHSRLLKRGIEGIQTPMVGREPEMAAMQNSYMDAIHGGEIRLILVKGDAGIGKTRLLDEFVRWVGAQGEAPVILRGNASTSTQSVPLGAFRDLFAKSFEIYGGDSSVQAMSKFRQGTRKLLEKDQADLVGQLVGFNFQASPAVQPLLGSPSFAQMACMYLVNYFRRLSEKPLLILFEDLHWMDDTSLDLILDLVTNLEREVESRLMLVCTARTRFFERKPKWGENFSGFSRLELHKLSRLRSRSLIADILYKTENIPEELYSCIMDEADGNPFFIEELIKMLMEEGVIETDHDTWNVRIDKLAEVHVPPTLTGILQARLDSLPAREKLVLQRASVIGRTFWDGLVQAMTEADGDAGYVNQSLAALRERGLILQQGRSVITGNQEYLFKHALLRDATYETVLLKHRHIYHNKVASWIEENAGERLEEHLALVASHYAAGGQLDLAADWYMRAGERATNQCSMQEARILFEHAINLISMDDLPRRWRAILGHDQAVGTLGLLEERHTDDSTLLSLASQMGNDSHLAEAYYRIGSQALTEGNHTAALQAFEQAMQASRRANDTLVQALILPMQIFVHTAEGELHSAEALVDQALEIARQTGRAEIMARTLTNLAPYYLAVGDINRSVQLMQEQVEINRRQGNRLGEAMGLLNLGYYYVSLGQFENGRDLLEDSLHSAQSMGARNIQAYALLNLGLVEWRRGKLQEACQVLQLCLPMLEALGDQRGLASRMFYLGLTYEKAGDIADAAVHFHEARNCFAMLGAEPQMVEAQAGVARVALKSGDLTLAEKNAREIIEYLREHGPQSLELPILVFLGCARVFSVLGDTELLRYTLDCGRMELQARLNCIEDESWRETYLAAVPENKEIMGFESLDSNNSCTKI